MTAGHVGKTIASLSELRVFAEIRGNSTVKIGGFPESVLKRDRACSLTSTFVYGDFSAPLSKHIITFNSWRAQTQHATPKQHFSATQLYFPCLFLPIKTK